MKDKREQLILVLDAWDRLREELIEILEFEGYRAIGCGDGVTGLAQARQHLPDLIISEISLPKLNGYEVVEAVRADPELRKTAFMFLTSRSERSDIRRGLELGADDFITKPFEAEDLLRAIESRLQQTRN